MIVTFLVNLELDEADIEREASRHGYPLQTARTAILADVENILADSVRWRDAVANVGVQMFGTDQSNRALRDTT